MKSKKGFVAQFNGFVGKLLGKSRYKKRTISNTGFILILVTSILVLWGFTGFYYVAEGEVGVLLNEGHIYKITDGETVGFNWPYPFGEIVVVNNMSGDSDNNSLHHKMIALSSNLIPVSIDDTFGYQIINHKKLNFNSLPQLSDIVSWNLELYIKDYIASKSADTIVHGNLTIISNEIMNQANSDLLYSLGVKINKLEITHLALMNANDNHDNSDQLVLSLMNEANLYHDDKLKFTHNMLNQLQESFSAQTMVDTLNANFDDSRYSLLRLNLKQLIDDSSAPRDVDRERKFRD